MEAIFIKKLLIALSLTALLVGCSESKSNVQNVIVKQEKQESTKNNGLNFEIKKKTFEEYMELGSKIEDVEYNHLFGNFDDYESIVKTLGEPFSWKELPKLSGAPDVWRYTFKNDVEVDTESIGYGRRDLVNYVKIGEQSTFKSSKGIGMGSTTLEIQNAYQNDINWDLSDDHIIYVGSEYRSIIFQLENDKVISFYLTTISNSSIKNINERIQQTNNELANQT